VLVADVDDAIEIEQHSAHASIIGPTWFSVTIKDRPAACAKAKVRHFTACRRHVTPAMPSRPKVCEIPPVAALKPPDTDPPGSQAEPPSEPMSNLGLVSGKSERRAARSVIAEYHDAQLGDLVERVGRAIDRYRAGELDAFDVDRVLFQYSRAAKELWKFCNYLQVEIAAAIIRERPPTDWWERGEPREQ